MQKLSSKRWTLLPALALILVAGLTVIIDRGPGRLLPDGASLAPTQGYAAATTDAARRDVPRTRVDSVGQEGRGRLESAYGRLPLSFEQNAGQFGRGVNFAARGDGYSISLKPTEVVLSLHGHSGGEAEAEAPPAPAEASPERRAPNRIRVRMAGANPAPRVAGAARLPGVSNYFIGREPAAWRTGVPTFARVEYGGVYPGVDLVYYGSRRQLEYDFIVAPGADPRRIALEFEGAEGVRLDANGDLVLGLEGGGELRQLKPVSYQVVGGERREVESRYALSGEGRATFELGEYDPSRPLVIDPVLSYSSYLGGSGFDEALAAARGSDGSLYVTGATGSLNFPNTGGVQASPGGSADAFVLKLNPAGTAVVYATYVGGQLFDTGTGIAVDADGNAYVSGYAVSANFPTTAGALQPAKALVTDAFALKLNASGASLAYSTFLGGPSYDLANGIAVDSAGRAYIAGYSHSARFINGAPVPKAGSPVYKTTDSAANWQPARNGFEDSVANAFAIHPTDSNTIYAGTNAGVYKTTDGGATWQLTGSGHPTNDPIVVTALAIDPVNPSTLYVASSNTGIYKTTDGGATWTRPNNGFFANLAHAVAVHPTQPNTVFAGTPFGAYKTIDGGAMWVEINSGLGNQFNPPDVFKFAIDPADPSIIYAAVEDGVYKTTNSGATWANSSNGITANGSTSVRVNTVAVDPAAPSVIYAGVNNGGVFKSTNAGASWTPSNAGLQEQNEFGTFAYSVVALAIQPSTSAAPSSVLYAGARSRGIFKSTDGGATWSPSNTGITNRNISNNALELDRANPATVYAGFTTGSDAFAVRLNASGTAADYSVFLGGDDNDAAAGVALDSAGNAHLAGSTNSLNFPVVSPLQATSGGGGTDIFVAKLNTAGAAVYSTYLGGNSVDEARAVAVDAAGRAHVTGRTFSANFPLAGPRQTALNSFGPDLFVTRLSAAGSSLEYSVLHGGRFDEEGLALALDPAGNA